MSNKDRGQRDEFRRKLKEEWGLLWQERFDDRVRAEGVSVREYSLLLTERGSVIFDSRDAKRPSLSALVDYWSARGLVYSPDPNVGGWGRFIRTCLNDAAHSRSKSYRERDLSPSKVKQQLKKSGKGWLHQ
jgi:hypothetical protein